MILSQDQIKYIDDYLIKNKVRYWDVRMEVLDHICKATEERMEKGMTFNDAILKAHIDFGNDPIKERLSIDNSKWETHPDLLADNSGYKELIKLKYQQLQNSFRSTLFKDLKKFFTTPATLFLYVLIIGTLGYLSALTDDPKLILKITMLPPFIIILFQIFIGLFTFRKTFKSLYILTAWSTGFLGLCLNNLTLYIPRVFFFGDKEPLPTWLLLGSAMVLLPIIYVGLELYLKELKKYSSIKRKLI